MKNIIIYAGGQLAGREYAVKLINAICLHGYTPIQAIEAINEMKSILNDIPLDKQLEGLESIEAFIDESQKIQFPPLDKILLSEMAELATAQKIGETREENPPVNYMFHNPPRQKKHRYFVPDKRAINRKNRKRK